MDTHANGVFSNHGDLGNPMDSIQHPVAPLVVKEVNRELDVRIQNSLCLMR